MIDRDGGISCHRYRKGGGGLFFLLSRKVFLHMKVGGGSFFSIGKVKGGPETPACCLHDQLYSILVQKNMLGSYLVMRGRGEIQFSLTKNCRL